MRLNSSPWWLWLIPIVVLIIATTKMPYEYYTFTRITICGFAVFFAVAGWAGSPLSRICSAILGLVAVLFNPVMMASLGGPRVEAAARVRSDPGRDTHADLPVNELQPATHCRAAFRSRLRRLSPTRIHLPHSLGLIIVK